MSDMLYRKVGRRYIPVGHEFMGWPATGVWLVQEHSSSLVLDKISEIPSPVSYAKFALHRATIASEIINHRYTEESAMNIADAVIKAVYESNLSAKQARVSDGPKQVALTTETFDVTVDPTLFHPE